MNQNRDNRQYVIIGIFLVVGIIFITRLLFLQVIDESFAQSAENQSVRYVTQYPPRGIIYDRNGDLLVYNEAAFDLMVLPKQVKEIDTNLFCETFAMDPAVFTERFNEAKAYSRHKPSVFISQITADEWGRVAEKMYHFPGFYGEKRTLRKYPNPIASSVMGYIGEVTSKVMESDDYYAAGDYIGINGIEKTYEEELRGKRGVKVFLVDVHNNIQSSYQNGKLDSVPIPGKDLTSTLDIQLQKYGEELMVNKKGSIVAIEPSTGEILAMVTAPSYDPNLLVGRGRSENYKMLAANDSLNPLFNRSINAMYRPGSIFKLIQSLVGQQYGIINPNTRFRCNRSIMGCHGAHTNDNLPQAIQHSCNPYFYQVYKRLIQTGEYSSIFKDSEFGLNKWREYVLSFGFGTTLEVDLPGVKRGRIPDSQFYDKWYGNHRWAFSTIYSNSIGEGELGVVPIQMANLAAILANRGYYITPHLVKQIGADGPRDIYLEKHYTKVDSQYYEVVLDAMQAVVDQPSGTARRARIKNIDVCGKTGTVQNSTTPDHSVFIAFAPRENPKIAIAVYVEEAGFGGTWAAPIASLMMEYYIKGEVVDSTKQEYILNADFIHTTDQ